MEENVANSPTNLSDGEAAIEALLPESNDCEQQEENTNSDGLKGGSGRSATGTNQETKNLCEGCLHSPVQRILQYFSGGEESALTKTQAAMILMSFSYGSAVIILPNTVLALGSVTWMLFIAIIVTITGYCAFLNHQSTCYLMSQTKSDEAVRDPYPAMAELACGPIFRNLVAFTMYVAMVTNSLAYILLAASLLNDSFPFQHWNHYNSIRMWVFIACLPVTPLMFFGSFVDLMGAATFAVTASSVSLLAIITNCMIAHFQYGAISDLYVPKKPLDDRDIFVNFGLITFAVAGPSFAVPNILVHVKDRKKFPGTIACTFGTIFVLYVFSGIIPYTIFGKYTQTMVTNTFWSVYAKNPKSLIVPIFTIICDVSMSLHLLLEGILVINPLYQHVEEYLKVPIHFNWKRVAVRSGGILTILVSCLAFPSFRSVLSMVGGVPLTLVGIIYPLFIHTRIFDNNLFTKILHSVLGIFFLVFMIGNLGVSIFYLIRSALKASQI